MIRLLIYFFLLQSVYLFAANFELPAKSAVLNRLLISEDTSFNRRTLLKELALKEGDKISEQVLKDRFQKLLRYCQTKGFYFARIDSLKLNFIEDSTRVDIEIFFNSGKVVQTGDLSLSGLPRHLVPDIEEELQTQNGQIFYSDKLEEDIASILNTLVNSGYPFAQVEISDLKYDSQSGELDIALDTKTGLFVEIDELVIEGNSVTKRYVIERELGFSWPSVYRQRRIERIPEQLKKLGYFKNVKLPYLQRTPEDDWQLVVKLEEGNYNRFDGILGYNPATQSAPGFFSGFIDVGFGNLFGTGRKVEARWERRTRNTQQLRLHYTEPWIFGLPLSAEGELEQIIQDTSYVERQFGIGLRYFYNDRISLFSHISRRSVSPDSNAVKLLDLQASSSTNFKIGLTIQTIDDILNPQRGLRYQTSFELGKKQIDRSEVENGTAGSSDLKRISIDFEMYISLFKLQVLALGFHGRQVTSDEPLISIADQYRFGGTRTLRGYREEQFRGSRIAWSNIEYRYLLGSRSRLFVFFDAGYFSREELQNQQSVKISNEKIGYGFGLRVETKLGYIGIDYGLGYGDGFSEGKIHIGLTNEF